MKKPYTKPVMESEEFVANEYVAACWEITCKASDSHPASNPYPPFVVGGNFARNDFDQFFASCELNSDTIHVGTDGHFTEKNNNEKKENQNKYYHTFEDTICHELTVALRGDGTGANAS